MLFLLIWFIFGIISVIIELRKQYIEKSNIDLTDLVYLFMLFLTGICGFFAELIVIIDWNKEVIRFK